MPLAMGTAGSAVVFAALTVIIALCGLTVVGIPFLTIMGLAAAASVTVALLIALTLLPTMLGFAGPRVATFTRLPLLGARAERAARRSAADPGSPAGAGWARFVVRHRVLVLIGGIAVLGVLAIPATQIRLGLPSGASQPAGNTQRQAYDLTTKGFGAGFKGPLLIVAQDVRSPADTKQIAGALDKLPDVAQVAPVTTQNGISLIKLIPESGPGDPATAILVHTIRDDRTAIEGQTGAHILVGGTTASNLDVSAKLSAALPIFLIVVAGLAFILLTFAFRTILVPATSILGFLLSMAAALGAQVSDRGRRFPAPPSSEPCLPLVAAHGSSSPRGRSGSCGLLVRAVRPAVWVAAGAVGVYEAVFRPAGAVVGDGLAGHRLADGREPGLPLAGGVRCAVGEQQQFSACRAQPSLAPQGGLPGGGQLRGFLLPSPVGPVPGQGRVVGRVPAGDRRVPDDLRPGVLVEVGSGFPVAEDPPVAPVRVEQAEVAGGHPSPALPGVPAESPLVKLPPQVAVQGLEGLLGRPGPVVVRLAPDDRIEDVDHLGHRGTAHCAQFVGESPPDLLHRIAAGPGEDLAALAGPVAAYVEGEEIEAVAYPADPGLLLVEGQAPLLEPRAELRLDRFRLLAAVA